MIKGRQFIAGLGSAAAWPVVARAQRVVALFATLVGAALALGAGAQAQQGGPAAADLIIFNGKVVTIDDQFSIKSALAVKDGKIVALGGPEIARDYQALARIDLKGRALLPGFIDTHVHVEGISPREIAIEQAKSIADIQRLIREKAKQLGPGEWITGRGWSEYELAEQRRPLRADLESLTARNMVRMSQVL